MITNQIDLGQIILGTIIATLGWLIKRELYYIYGRLDKHEQEITDLIREVGILIGRGGGSRRYYDRDRGDT